MLPASYCKFHNSVYSAAMSISWSQQREVRSYKNTEEEFDPPKYCKQGLSTVWILIFRRLSMEKLLSSVDPLMFFQMLWLTESLFTVWTLVRFFSSVDPLMCFQRWWVTGSCHSVNTCKVFPQCEFSGAVLTCPL